VAPLTGTAEVRVSNDAPMKRRLAAILAADIAGYSRLMGEDEAATVRELKGHQAVVLPLIAQHGGRIIDTAGDGILASSQVPSVRPSAPSSSRPSWSRATPTSPSIVACCSASGSIWAT
jgi:class 3 adenylate cyclase